MPNLEELCGAFCEHSSAKIVGIHYDFASNAADLGVTTSAPTPSLPQVSVTL